MRALALVGRKWTILIVRELLPGSRRFTQIQRSLGADPKVIATRLHELTAEGLLTRVAYAEVPPRVEYSLTKSGKALERVVDDLRRWGSARRQVSGPQGQTSRGVSGLSSAEKGVRKERRARP